MSNPTSGLVESFQTAITDLINAGGSILSSVASALSTYAPVIGEILIAVGIGYLGFKLIGRIPFVTRLFNMLTGA